MFITKLKSPKVIQIKGVVIILRTGRTKMLSVASTKAPIIKTSHPDAKINPGKNFWAKYNTAPFNTIFTIKRNTECILLPDK